MKLSEATISPEMAKKNADMLAKHGDLKNATLPPEAAKKFRKILMKFTPYMTGKLKQFHNYNFSSTDDGFHMGLGRRVEPGTEDISYFVTVQLWRPIRQLFLAHGTENPSSELGEMFPDARITNRFGEIELRIPL